MAGRGPALEAILGNRPHPVRCFPHTPAVFRVVPPPTILGQKWARTGELPSAETLVFKVKGIVCRSKPAMKPLTILRDKLTNATTTVTDGANHVAEELQSRAKDAWDTVHNRTDRAVQKSTTYLHKNPVPVALTAFGLGMVVGALLSRRAPGSARHRFFAPSPHPSSGAPYGLIIACLTLVRSIFFPAPRCVAAGTPVREDHSRPARGDDGKPEEASSGAARPGDGRPH